MTIGMVPGDLFYGADRRFAVGDNHIRFERGELGRERWEPPIVALRRAHLHRDILPFDIAEFVETAPECPDVYLGCPRAEKSDQRQRPPLCPRRAVRCNRRADDKGEEVAPPHSNYLLDYHDMVRRPNVRHDPPARNDKRGSSADDAEPPS